MPDFTAAVAPTPRSQIASTARGVISESVPIATCNTTSIPAANAASGTAVYSLIGLRAGDVVTNIVVNVAIAGSGLTFAKLGLYSSTGTFLAATASVSASFNSGTGFVAVPLTSPYSIAADGGYYGAFLQYGSGATGATLLASAATTTSGVQYGSSARAQCAVASQTDISGNVTLADSSAHKWLGVS